MTAIVCNCAFNGLSIIQELGRKGVDVHALDSFRNIGTTSRYATYHKCPNPTTDEEGFIHFLIELSEEFDGKPVLIPANDHWASAIANNLDRLNDHYRPCVADGETVDLLLDKRAFGAWAQDRAYPVPRTWDGDEIENIPDDAFPIAAKPGDARDVPDMMFRSRLVSVWNRITGGRPKVQSNVDMSELRRKTELYERLRLEVVENQEELEAFINSHPELVNDFAFQEYVRGMSDSMYTVGVYANEGDVKGVFTGRKIRGYPPDIGDCKVGQVEPVPDQLVVDAKSICDELDYTGIAEFEYKRDTETGEFYLIEVNPRSWSWIGITPACSDNLPWIAYTNLHRNKDISNYQTHDNTESVTWVKASEDLINVLLFYRSVYPEWAGGPLYWWQSVNADRIVFAEGTIRDPIPIIYSIVLIARRFIKTIINNFER